MNDDPPPLFWAPKDATARVIANIFAADTNVKNYVITGQDADKASLQYINNGRQGWNVPWDFTR